VSKEITSSFTDVEVEVIEGGKGEFSVIYQDDPPALLYSTDDKHRLPTNNEITMGLSSGLENRRLRNMSDYSQLSILGRCNLKRWNLVWAH